MVIHKGSCRSDVTFFTFWSIKRSYRTVTVLLSIWALSENQHFDGNEISPFPVQNLLLCSPAGISALSCFRVFMYGDCWYL